MAFDPYHLWLSIPPAEQPPNHYRLLGLPLFEDSLAVIEAAADRQMGHLRTYQTGPHVAECQRLLNEVASARVCLLHAEKKAAYDASLRTTLSAASSPATADPEIQDAASGAFDVLASDDDRGEGGFHSRPRPRRKNQGAIIGAAVVGVLIVVALLVWRASSGSTPKLTAVNEKTAPLNEKAQPRPTTAVAKRSEAPSPAAKPEPKTATAPSQLAPKVVKAEPAPEIAPPPEKPPMPEVAAAEKSKPEEADEGSAKKIAPPSADEQKKLIARMDEVYKVAEAKDQAAKAAVARNLLEEGRKTEAKRAEQFVFFRRAGEIARDAGEVDLMFDAVDALAEAGFNVQPFQIKARFLKNLVEQDSSAGASRVSMVSAACVTFAEQAAANGAVEEASEVLAAAQEALAAVKKQAQQTRAKAKLAVNRTRNPAERAAAEKKAQDAEGELEAVTAELAAVSDCAKGIQRTRRQQEAIDAARERLKTQPDDSDACLLVGSWDCFDRGDWDEGLKLLAKGSDEALKAMAAEELSSKPATAEEQRARGDKWWELAEKAEGKAKAAMRHRAAGWYEQALPNLIPGLDKTTAQRRIAQATDETLPGVHESAARTRPPLAVAPFDSRTAIQHQTRWAKHFRAPAIQTNSIGMKLMLIPPGSFTMGSSEGEGLAHEHPAHQVGITKAFYMGAYEVTVGQYRKFVEDKKYDGGNGWRSAFPSQTDDHPAANLIWDDAAEFCKWLSGKEGKTYRLPTEAEWEYACRAGSTTRFYFGDDESRLADYAWLAPNAGGSARPVGQKRPNAWALYDMLGNEWEWCEDWYGENYYRVSPPEVPTGPSSGTARVLRGASYGNGPADARSAHRTRTVPVDRSSFFGFRVCLVPADKATAQRRVAQAAEE